MNIDKTWKNALEKVEGRLKKRNWILPNLSFRGRVLIINNLAAYMLGHRLACVNLPVDNTAGLSSTLAVSSVRVISRMIKSWKDQLTEEEIKVIVSYCESSVEPTGHQPLVIIQGCSGVFLIFKPISLSYSTSKQKYK